MCIAEKKVDGSKGFRDILSIIKDLKNSKVFQSMKEVDQLKAVNEIFGKIAGNTMKIFLANIARATDLQKGLTKVPEDFAQKQANRLLTETLWGSLKLISSAFEGIIIAVMDSFKPFLKWVTPTITSILNSVTTLIEKSGGLVGFLLSFTAVLLSLSVAVSGLLFPLFSLMSGFFLLKGVLKAFFVFLALFKGIMAGVLPVLAGVSASFVAVAAAVAVAIGGLVWWFINAKDRANSFTEAFSVMWQDFINFFVRLGEILANVFNKFKWVFPSSSDSVSEVGSSGSGFFGNTAAKIREIKTTTHEQNDHVKVTTIVVTGDSTDTGDVTNGEFVNSNLAWAFGGQTLYNKHA